MFARSASSIGFFTQVTTAAVEKWITRTEHELDLKERLVNLRLSMDRSAAEGRWNEIQHNLPVYKQLLGEYKRLKR